MWAVVCGGDAGRKPTWDAALRAPPPRKFPLLHSHPENHFLPMAPSALPPWPVCRGVQKTIPIPSGGHQEDLLGQRGDVGGKQDPSQLCWNLGQEDLSKQNMSP